ncbi:MAG: HRDC domain-containing protein [Candidatus Latescibacterota bacterium]|jgi:ribonuclease D
MRGGRPDPIHAVIGHGRRLTWFEPALVAGPTNPYRLGSMNPDQPMIDTPEALARLAGRLEQAERIALDTEFVWDRTYYPKMGLVQVGLDDGECYLIDAVALPDLSTLAPAVSSPERVKILHDAPQDLTIVRRVTGAFPRTVFDTRCAAGLAGLSSTTSLGDLVAQAIGVSLPKTESRTNWLQRPLAPEQVEYAVDDVRYLGPVRAELLSRVAALGRAEWLTEELGGLDDPELYVERDPQQQYLRVRGAGRASPRELAILRELAAWREEEARRCDRPRERVLPDASLVRLARSRPRALEQLRGTQGLARRYVEPILEAVARGLAVPDRECPRRRRIRDEARAEALLEQAMSLVRHRSQAAGIDAPFVATRAEVRGLMADGPAALPEQHRLLRGWRRGVVGEELLALMTDGRHPR